LKGLIDLVDYDSLALQQNKRFAMPWNETDREKYAVIRERYASDLSDEEFALVQPLLPAPNTVGRKPTDPRVIVDALFYLIRAGCPWRYLPKDFPPFTTVQRRILSTIYLQNIYASALDENSTTTASDEISDILRTTHRLKSTDEDDFAVRTMQELINTFSSTSQLLTILLAVISGISLLVGGIGIMNIMYVSVTERTKEIGLRMSIGARGMDILLQFLTEAILISITGGIIGVVLGITSARLVTIFLSWPTLVTEYSILLSFLVCFITGVFFGYYPAQKASRLDPIEALRYE